MWSSDFKLSTVCVCQLNPCPESWRSQCCFANPSSASLTKPRTLLRKNVFFIVFHHTSWIFFFFWCFFCPSAPWGVISLPFSWLSMPQTSHVGSWLLSSFFPQPAVLCLASWPASMDCVPLRVPSVLLFLVCFFQDEISLICIKITGEACHEVSLPKSNLQQVKSVTEC